MELATCAKVWIQEKTNTAVHNINSVMSRLDCAYVWQMSTHSRQKSCAASIAMEATLQNGCKAACIPFRAKGNKHKGRMILTYVTKEAVKGEIVIKRHNTFQEGCFA